MDSDAIPIINVGQAFSVRGAKKKTRSISPLACDRVGILVSGPPLRAARRPVIRLFQFSQQSPDFWDWWFLNATTQHVATQ
jgi:hypothetical protein